MTRIYLDVHDRVCVDKTPTGEEANKAEFARTAVKTIQLLEKAAVRLEEIAAEAETNAGPARMLKTSCGQLLQRIYNQVRADREPLSIVALDIQLQALFALARTARSLMRKHLEQAGVL